MCNSIAILNMLLMYLFFLIFSTKPFCAPVGSNARQRPSLTGITQKIQTRQIDPETGRKLEQIMKRQGILTIDNAEYKTEIKDLEDLGELGSGTSGHVFKMRHHPSKKVIAVKVLINNC